MSEKPKRQATVDLQQVAIWTVVATVVSIVLNVIVFMLTQGQFEGALAFDQPFSTTPIIVATAVQIIAGGIFLVVLDRVVTHPIKVWTRVATVVLIASLIQPFTLLEWAEGVEPLAMTPFILSAMHIIAGVVTIYLLSTRTAKSA